MNNTPNPSQEFTPGQIVFLKANPTTRGAVVAVLPGTPEDRISVFVNGSVQTFYPSQLQIEVQTEQFQSLSCDEFHAYLTALQIRYPAISALYSLNAARVDFIPYQYRPVLKFIKADLPRLLIADSVGVGKTIEAGLILRELQARTDIESVLIICPRPLVSEQKWQREMKRFDENFMHLDGKTLQYCIREMHLDGEWPERYQKVILPYSLLSNNLLFGPGGKRNKKSGKGLLDLDPPPRFDLVIVDEAHHIRNQGTANHEAVRFFCENADAVVFLTATPIQLGSHDLFVLLNVLRPDLILDEASFNHIAEPNPFINQAVDAARAQETGWIQIAKEALDAAASTAWGQSILKNDPEFKRVRNHLAEGRMTPEDRVQLITDMEALHTFAGIINRTRRRDIGEFTIRKPQAVEVALTTEQDELHEAILEMQKEIFRRLHGDRSVNFMVTTLRRQLASCLHGLEPLLADILTRRLDKLEWSEVDAIETMPSEELVTSIRGEVQALLERAKTLDPEDLKLAALRKVVRNRQRRRNNKVMIFSSFRHTLAYLHKHLLADGFRVGLIHGDVPDEERLRLRNQFEQPKTEDDSLDLMLFSEVGCEGLDYQFCDCIVNYDLPWNPMKVEQRIGRIDRRGQKSESVTIINLITPGTVDADIYERCLLRIGVFESALGGSEEILGEITTELRNIAEDYGLTPEERKIKLQQLADNKILLVQEQEKLEAQQLDLFGLRFPEDKMEKEVADAASFWLSPTSIQGLVIHYLLTKIGTEQEFILGEKPLKTLRLSEAARNALLGDFQQFSREKTRVYREWEKWLKGSDQHLSITFEADCAVQYPDATFIMPTHPLVKQAAAALKTDEEVVTSLKVRTNKVPAGRYEFAIYQWRFLGIREHVALKPVATSDVLTPHLNGLLERAADSEIQENPILTEKDALENAQQQLWAEARAEHQERTRALASYRKESLSTSHQKRVKLLKDRIAQATDPNIQRMRRSELANAEVEYRRRTDEFDEAAAKADVTTELVAYGVLEAE
ncbi:helicase [Candidatus Poribacteria bacterium]|nr:helicase [Candidatus Poribacteria bacterium]MYK18998.1 helicase [Candidatus Poribacteria bacterium]